MKGNPQVIAALKNGAALEAHLVLQFQLYARSLRQIGLKSIAKDVGGFSKDARWFLKKLTDRILFLEGDLGYEVDPIEEQSEVMALVKDALELEMNIVQPFEQGVAIATESMDDTSRNLFEHLLKWHQDHLVKIERWNDLIATIGVNDFIAANI